MKQHDTYIAMCKCKYHDVLFGDVFFFEKETTNPLTSKILIRIWDFSACHMWTILVVCDGATDHLHVLDPIAYRHTCSYTGFDLSEYTAPCFRSNVQIGIIKQHPDVMCLRVFL